MPTGQHTSFQSPRSYRESPLLAFLLSAALFALLSSPIYCQGAKSFCNLQKVEVEHFSNGVRIKLIADGLQELGGDIGQFITPEGNDLAALDRITFPLNNVRGGVDSVVQIADYPVSHLEFSLPPGRRDNVGLLCTLVLYKPGYVVTFSDKENNWDVAQWYWNWPQVMIQTKSSQDEIDITVLSDRPEEPEVAHPTIGKPKTDLQVSGNRDKLSLRALNMDIHAVLEAVSSQAQIPIFVDEQVQRTLTANFDTISLDRFLNSLALAYGLSVAQEEDAWYVSPCTPQNSVTAWNSVTRTLQLNYLTPAEAELLLPTVLLPYVKPNPAANALVVSGPVALLDHIQQNLAKIDQPAYQCRLKAYLVSAAGEANNLHDILLKLTGGTTSVRADSNGTLGIEFKRGNADDILASLRRLEQQHVLRISSLPSIMCKSGQWASLFVGETIYYWAITDAWQNDKELASVYAGSRLLISPSSSGEWVRARVSVENSFLADRNELGPVVGKRRASSLICIPSGDMVIIGSLKQTNRDDNVQRTAPGVWPLDAVLTGKLKHQEQGEVYVLLRAESALLPRIELPAALQTGAR